MTSVSDLKGTQMPYVDNKRNNNFRSICIYRL